MLGLTGLKDPQALFKSLGLMQLPCSGLLHPTRPLGQEHGRFAMRYCADRVCSWCWWQPGSPQLPLPPSVPPSPCKAQRPPAGTLMRSTLDTWAPDQAKCTRFEILDRDKWNTGLHLPVVCMTPEIILVLPGCTYCGISCSYCWGSQLFCIIYLSSLALTTPWALGWAAFTVCY